MCSRGAGPGEHCCTHKAKTGSRHKDTLFSGFVHESCDLFQFSGVRSVVMKSCLLVALHACTDIFVLFDCRMWAAV